MPLFLTLFVYRCEPTFVRRTDTDVYGSCSPRRPEREALYIVGLMVNAQHLLLPSCQMPGTQLILSQVSPRRGRNLKALGSVHLRGHTTKEMSCRKLEKRHGWNARLYACFFGPLLWLILMSCKAYLF
ncbi:hypothetical protein MVEN_01842700 [Mycena venus]|uniref:Uncharacterized protein n=1 Tax=Mycena venus TaxID=2733690 RepID=A0A8H6XJ66_9AGAR|nr:hypothetical protein MVEN_01842700 [Mycena venus]